MAAPPPIADRFAALPTFNLFAHFSGLANAEGAVNLGQGFPSYGAPDFARAAVAAAAEGGANQYAPPRGHPELLAELARLYSPAFGRELDPASELATFSGGQEGLAAVMHAFVNPGDGVACVEPFFDAVKNAALLAGAEFRGVPLRPRRGGDYTGLRSTAELALSMEELRGALTPRTRVLCLNTPHNPTGKVFSRRELEEIAAVVREHPGLVVLSDEVYEHMCFDGRAHARFATLPGMWGRTLTLHSAGKTFSATGWRVGYAIGPAALVAPLVRYRQATSFCGPTPVEKGLVAAFAHAARTGYFAQLNKQLQDKRDRLVRMCERAGLHPIVPEGGYFVLADASGLGAPVAELVAAARGAGATDLQQGRDFVVAEWMTRELKITGIPPSPFFMPRNRGLCAGLVRFCFAKDDALLAAAEEKMRALTPAAGRGGARARM